jgi:hypothetical protein
LAYTQTTLDALCAQIGTLLDDAGELYWTLAEKRLAVWEALRVWGAATSYWRARGYFNLTPGVSWYDLATELPVLRSRTTMLDQIVREIQYMLLEPATGIAGTPSSGQVSIASILAAVARARNRFVIDTKGPYTIHPDADFTQAADGMTTLPATTIFLHRLSYLGGITRTWVNLWRDDAWGIDHASPTWPLLTGVPVAFSESENSPLDVQLIPPPATTGLLEGVTVDSLVVDTTDATAVFDVPDEYVHAIKYAALADLLASESQLADPMRAQYAETRYQQAVAIALEARSIIRLLIGDPGTPGSATTYPFTVTVTDATSATASVNCSITINAPAPPAVAAVPLPIDTLANIDAGMPFWRNQVQKPTVAGIVADLLAVASVPDRVYGIAADVVRAAPLPGPAEYIQIGREDLQHLVEYVVHILTFKCGGNEFQSTFAGYDAFLSACVGRNNILAADARYLTATFNKPRAEQHQRPDRIEKRN